jgi:hypothetical protein
VALLGTADGGFQFEKWVETVATATLARNPISASASGHRIK